MPCRTTPFRTPSDSATRASARRVSRSTTLAGSPVLVAASNALNEAGMATSLIGSLTSRAARSGCTSTLREIRFSSTVTSDSRRSCSRSQS